MKPEASLQAAWQSLAKGFRGATVSGEPVTVLNPGVLNRSDGPDFLQAEIIIGGVRLFGAVELHVNCNGWYEHGHQNNARFNGVVLHVCGYHHGLEDVLLESGRFIPSIVFPFPNQNVARKDLPCRPFWGDMLQPAFEKQLAISKMRYLSICVGRLHPWMPAIGGPSSVMQHLVTGGGARLLGGTQNRAVLEDFARYLLGIPFSGPAVSGNSKGIFPAARPGIRKIQLEALVKASTRLTAEDVLTLSPEASWAQLVSFWEPRPGWLTCTMIYQLVWLPALMILAETVKSNLLYQRALSSWNASEHDVPVSIRRFFSGAPVQTSRNTGLVYQAKYICSGNNCQECAVYHRIIQSV